MIELLLRSWPGVSINLRRKTAQCSNQYKCHLSVSRLLVRWLVTIFIHNGEDVILHDLNRWRGEERRGVRRDIWMIIAEVTPSLSPATSYLTPHSSQLLVVSFLSPNWSNLNEKLSVLTESHLLPQQLFQQEVQLSMRNCPRQHWSYNCALSLTYKTKANSAVRSLRGKSVTICQTWKTMFTSGWDSLVSSHDGAEQPDLSLSPVDNYWSDIEYNWRGWVGHQLEEYWGHWQLTIWTGARLLCNQSRNHLSEETFVLLCHTHQPWAVITL